MGTPNNNMKSYLHSSLKTLFIRFYFLHYLVLSYYPSIINADNAYRWEPSISVAADLDEPGQKGYCIDIFGWAGALDCNLLKARTCKKMAMTHNLNMMNLPKQFDL